MVSHTTYTLGRLIGYGAYGHVFTAVEKDTGKVAAVKKARVSRTVKRPVLQHESRVLSILQGHPGIPVLYGYGQMPHFEYIAMELLGPNLCELVTGPVAVVTVARVLLQLFSALEHVHKQGFVHRDIKLSNIVCRQDDPSKIVLIDFGLSKPIQCDDSLRDRERFNKDGLVIGTILFASLNAHYGCELGPRDDLESVAYVAFFLLHGDLPWNRDKSIRSKNEAKMIGWEVREMKTRLPCYSLRFCPSEFGYLLDYSRRLKYKKMPAYASLRRRFKKLIPRADKPSMRKALDWSSISLRRTYSRTMSNVDAPKKVFNVIMLDGNVNESYLHLFMTDSDVTGMNSLITVPNVDARESRVDSTVPDVDAWESRVDSTESCVDAPVPKFCDSYRFVDEDCWTNNMQRVDRHETLTLPSKLKEEVDSKIATFSLEWSTYIRNLGEERIMER
ncbi:kinase-like domain-containing protein [Cyathus striatus]|nr:kinase-like domain-containing protein [Cyathus striatus]